MKSVVLICALLLSTMGLAQTQAPSKPAETAPAANPADVKSIDSITNALYEVISGPAGQKRDWNRFRSLFWKTGKLVPIVAKPDKSGYAPREMTPEEFVAHVDPIVEKEPFFENGVANRVEQWTRIANVFSTYESRRAKGEKPFARGINTIQMFNDGQRWWITSIMWQQESEQDPLPARMLKAPSFDD